MSLATRSWKRASPHSAEDLRNDHIRSRWDPWDSLDSVSTDGRNIRRISGGGLGQKEAQATLSALRSSGKLEGLKRATPTTTDVVYFIQRESGGAVKVGHTTMKGLRARVRDFQVAHWEPLEIRGLFDGGAWLEAALHQLFSDSRLRGEWFSVTETMQSICPEVIDGPQKA